MGEIRVSDVLAYFYFLTGDGWLMEVEVEHQMDERRISRVVTGEMRDPAEVEQLLAS